MRTGFHAAEIEQVFDQTGEAARASLQLVSITPVTVSGRGFGPGEPVVLTVIAGTVQVTTKALAMSSGHEGDIVRVIPDGGKALRARITRPGAVEVVQ